MARTVNLLIRPGDRSTKVSDVQARLRSLGAEINDEPGVFGSSTERALRAFQQRRGILVDGKVGPHTWRELVAAGWRLGDRSLYLRNPPFRGDDVEVLQTRLNALGFDSGRADGIFGTNTDQAVRAFQREYDVPEDGISGPRSLRALTGLRVDRAGTTSTLREEIRRDESPGISGAVIMVDPGHGPGDEGAEVGDAPCEAELCWDLGTRVATKLAGAGAHVRFTRSEKETPDDSERAIRANRLGADLFLSLHLNSHDEESAQGASTYYWAGSRAGEALAESVQSRLVDLGLANCRAHGRAYPVLKETRMPAVLIEPAFMTNSEDRERLQHDDFRDSLADAVVNGVRAYLDERSG